MFKQGDIVTKENYVDAANWCNAHPEERLRIIEIGDGQYKIDGTPDMTEQEKKRSVKELRNQILSITDKYTSVPDFPISDDEREQYKAYRQYLRDYTTIENWWENEPLTFEEWKKEQ